MNSGEHQTEQAVPVNVVENGEDRTDRCCAPTCLVERDVAWRQAAGRARLLSWLSLAYMAVEGAVAITAAILAGSVALLGFGLDSVIEGLASVRDHARASWLGVGLSVASLIIMPLLGIAKRHLGTRLDSGATAGEGTQNLLCAYLAAAVLVGLLTNALLGWWWLDPVIGLGIAGLAVREGIESWRGEDCC